MGSKNFCGFLLENCSSVGHLSSVVIRPPPWPPSHGWLLSAVVVFVLAARILCSQVGEELWSLSVVFWYKLWTRSAWQTDAFSDHVLRAQSMSESDCLDAVSPRRGYALPARMLFLTPTIWSSCFYSGLWLRRDTVAEPFQQSIITILFVFRGSLKIRKRIAFRLFERRLAI